MGYLGWAAMSLASAFWCGAAYVGGEFGFGRIGIGAKNPLYVRRNENPIAFWLGLAIAATASTGFGFEAVLRFLELHNVKL